MFGWRRRNEGFEWREYVRTTVLVRRADRQRRIEDARVAAVEKVKHAADTGAEAGRAGVSFLGSKISQFLALIVEALLDLAAAAFHLGLRWSKFLFAVVRDGFRALLAPLGTLLGGRVDALRERAKLLPDIARKSPIRPQHLFIGLAALGLIYVGGPILRSADGIAVADLSPEAAPHVTVSAELTGRAIAITGDLMRVDGALVRLNGIDAPDSAQPCYRANGRRWNCASAAKSGLARAVRGRRVSCTPTGAESGGYVVADCRIGGTDIAKEMVQRGYVFAERSFFSTLASEEDTARTAKRGIWQGEIQRPQDWRNQIWEEAKQNAPDGCPIKGLIRASSKFYTLPWSADYARAKVRTQRGERWFCSEDEAKAAGFAASDRS